MSEISKVKLSGSPHKSITWVWIENGQLKVEYYDYSEDAQRLFGNDIAYTLTVHEMEKLYLTLDKNETSIILWMEQHFESYFGIKQWLEENGIGLAPGAL